MGRLGHADHRFTFVMFNHPGGTGSLPVKGIPGVPSLPLATGSERVNRGHDSYFPAQASRRQGNGEIGIVSPIYLDSAT